MFRMRSTLLFLGSFLAAAVALTPPTAYACQLVCIVINDSGAASKDAQCNAAQSGFKVARKGMLASLPSIKSEFYGTQIAGGYSCSEIYLHSGLLIPEVGVGGGGGGGLQYTQSFWSAYNSCNTNNTPQIVCCNM